MLRFGFPEAARFSVLSCQFSVKPWASGVASLHARWRRDAALCLAFFSPIHSEDSNGLVLVGGTPLPPVPRKWELSRHSTSRTSVFRDVGSRVPGAPHLSVFETWIPVTSSSTDPPSR